MEIKVVFFGIDSVLVNVSRSYRRAIEETVSHFTGRDIESGTIERYKNLGGFSDDLRLTHAIVSDAGISVSLGRIIEEFQRRYRGDNWDGFIAEEEAIMRVRVLEQLSEMGLILGIVTARMQPEVQWTVERFGWKRYFPLIIPREKHEGRQNPDPYPLLRALAILDAAGRKIEASEAVYVGATVGDMRAARSAGMWALGACPPSAPAEEYKALLEDAGSHYVIGDANNIFTVMQQFNELVVPEPADEEEDAELESGAAQEGEGG